MANILNDTTGAILGLLHDGPMTGGQINAACQKWLAPYFSITRSQVYRELKTLEDGGLIRPGKTGPRASQPYKITAKGRAEFQFWLLDTSTLYTLRNQMALRIAFSGLFKDPRALQSMIEGAKARHMEELAAVERLLSEAEADDLHSDAAALTYAKVFQKATLAWLKALEINKVSNTA